MFRFSRRNKNLVKYQKGSKYYGLTVVKTKVNDASLELRPIKVYQT